MSRSEHELMGYPIVVEVPDYPAVVVSIGGDAPPLPVTPPSIVRNPASISFVEGGAGGTFTVALSKAPEADVVVSVSASGGNVTPSPASLTFTPTTWSATQTVTCTSPNDGTQSGNRSSTITLSSAGVSAPVTVSVTVTDAYVGSPPSNTALPVITGNTTVGSVLSCSQGTWTQSPTGYAYQWKRGGTTISGATSNQYTVAAADQGTAITCTVTATNATGSASATSAATNIPVAPPANTALPTITGSTALAGVLTCSQGTWSGSPSGYAYQWKRNGTAISGETAAAHTVVAADQGTTLTCMVTATNAGGSTSATSAGTAIPMLGAPENTVLPAITGTTNVGNVLTCSQGTWNNSPTAHAFQWKKGASNIAGQTASTYTIVAGDVGSTISCVVTATNATGSTPATAAGVLIPNTNRQLFVMMGQSNMVGRGTAAGASTVDPGKAYVYNHQTGAITSGIVEPIQGANAGATSTNYSLVPALVKAYTNQLPSKIPVVNKSCKGNMYINEMGPGQVMYQLSVDSTNAAKAAIAAEGNTVTDVWGFWLQGESDSVGAMSETEYKTKLADLLDRLRVDCGITKMFVLRVGYDLDNPELKVSTETIMRAQKKLCIERADFIMLANINAQFSLSTVEPFTGPTMSADAIHYTTYGYEVEGAEAGNSLVYYVNTGTKPPLVENVPELDVEEQPPTMIESRWDFTQSLNDQVGTRHFTVDGTNYTLDTNGLKIPSTASTNTHISLAQSITLDAAKDWAVEFEVTPDTVATVTSGVGTPIGNRTGGIKDCIWFGIGGDNTMSLIGTDGVYQPAIPISVPTGRTKYKFVFVSSTTTLYLVVNDQVNPISVPHTGIVKLRYLFSGYDTGPTYIFKGYIVGMSIRYDCNHLVELPAIEPVTLANFTFDASGIINDDTEANNLIVEPGREAGHTFTADGIRLLGGEHSGFNFQKSILLNRTSKWVVTWRSHWEENTTAEGAGYSASDGMLLADNTSYDWCYNGTFKTTLGSGVVNKGKPYFAAKRTFTVTHDPARGAAPLKYEIDGAMVWEGAANADWSIKRFGSGYNIKKYGFPGYVEYVYIAVNTTDPARARRVSPEVATQILEKLSG